MADDVVLPATGTTIATDDCTTGQVQLVKLAYGASGDRTQVGADANGLDVDVIRVPAPLNVVGGGAEATALRVTIANDSTGVIGISDNGDSITVDGVVTAITYGFTPHDSVLAGNPIAVGGYAKDAAPADVSADGDAVRAWYLRNGAQTTQPTFSGTLQSAGNGTADTAARVTIASDSTGVIAVTDNGGSLTIDGTVTANLAAGTNNIGDVDVLTVPAPLSTSGNGTAATALRVTIASDSTGVIAVTDNGGSLTVDGTVAVSSLPALAAGTNNIGDVDVLTLPAPLGAAGATSIAKAEDAASADADVGVPAMAVRKSTPANTSGTDGDYEMLQMQGGRLWTWATIDSALPAGTNNIGDVDVLTVPSDPFGANADAASASGSISAKLRQIATNGIPVTSLPALAAGSNNIGYVNAAGPQAHDAADAGWAPLKMAGYAKAAAPSDVSADGDIVNLWALKNGALAVNLTAAGALIPGDATNGLKTQPAGAVAHDGADSGNPVKVGARAASTLSDDTMVANGDRTDNVSDLDGALITRPGFPLGDLISERVTDTGGSSTAFTNFGATASTRSFITAIVVYNSSATAGTIDFRDGTGGSVLWTMPIPAGGGAVISNGGMPLFKTTANTALAYDVSGALSTVTISISGFKSKVV